MAATSLSYFRPNTIAHKLTGSNAYPRLSFRTPKVVAMSNVTFQPYWVSINADIEAHLRQAIPVKPPVDVFEPMHHLTLAAPQTTAPALCVAACELVGGRREQAIAAACALWLMHAAAFSHENLLSTGRPKPALARVFGPNIELLTGDGILPFGFELLSRSSDQAQPNCQRLLRVIIEMARATGSQGMVQGQYNELQYHQLGDNRSLHVGDWTNHVVKKREGELHACASACGAILGGGSEEEIERLRRYGLHVGMIQGISEWVGKEEKWAMEEANELRNLALRELKSLNNDKIEKISSLVETNLCNV